MELLIKWEDKSKKKRKPRDFGTNPRAKGTNPRAMSKRKSKAITVGESKRPCKICHGKMVVRKHKEITPKLKKQFYYFSQWDYCKNCNKVFFNESFKVNNAKGQDLEELERQENHLFNIK